MKRLKRLSNFLFLTTTLVALWSLLLFNTSAYASVPTVVLDGNQLSFDVNPLIVNGRVLVPMRAIFEALGARISWNDATQGVIAVKGNTAIAVQIGNPIANVNNSPVSLDVPPQIVDGRTMVPLRFVSEALGCTVSWDQQTYTVAISPATGRSSQSTSTDHAAPPTYHSDKYGFTITFPESWRNKYVVTESGHSVQVLQKSTYDASNGEMGRLFTVAVFSSKEWQAQGEDVMTMSENYGYVKTDHAVYYLGGPSDVQFDPDNKQAANEYKDMEKYIPTIAETFTLDQNQRNGATYGIIKASYTDNGISISYPQITNLDDSDKQKTVNDIIRSDALKGLSYYPDTSSQLTMEINYVIKRQSVNLLSIQYSGIAYVAGVAHPNNLFYTTNIDLHNGTRLRLKDLINVDSEFVTKFKSGQFTALNPEQNGVLDSFSSSDLLNDFNNADSLDSIGTVNQSDVFSYLTKDSLGISVSVAHAAGEHAEFEIKYKDIANNLKVESGVWNDFLGLLR